MVVLDMVLARLRKKLMRYDFDTMRRDFERIVSEWTEMDSSQFLADLPENKNLYAFFRRLNGRSL